MTGWTDAAALRRP